MNAEELAQRLIQCLAVEYGMQPIHLLAAMRDGASGNEAGLYQVIIVICFSHTIDDVGKHFEFSVLDTFSRCWNTMFSLSPAARCCGRQELAQQCDFFGDVRPFLRENNNLSPVCRASMLEIFGDPATARNLDIEFAAMIDAGKHFVQATYYLEGWSLGIYLL